MKRDRVIDTQKLPGYLLQKWVSRKQYRENRNGVTLGWGHECMYLHNGSHCSSKRVNKSIEVAVTVSFEHRERMLRAEF